MQKCRVTVCYECELRSLSSQQLSWLQKARNVLPVVFIKVARAVLQNYHYAAQVLNTVTWLRPAVHDRKAPPLHSLASHTDVFRGVVIKRLRGSLHSDPTQPSPPPPFPLHYACRCVFAFKKSKT